MTETISKTKKSRKGQPKVTKKKSDVQKVLDQVIYQHGTGARFQDDWESLLSDVGLTPADITPAMFDAAEKFVRDNITATELPVGGKKVVAEVPNSDEDVSVEQRRPTGEKPASDGDSVKNEGDEMKVYEMSARKLLQAMGLKKAQDVPITALQKKLRGLDKVLDATREPKEKYEKAMLKAVLEALANDRKITVVPGSKEEGEKTNGTNGHKETPVQEEKPSRVRKGKKTPEQEVTKAVKASKTKPTAKRSSNGEEKRLSALGAAEAVLSKKKGKEDGFSPKEIFTAIMEKDLWETNAEDPADALKACLYQDIQRKGKDSRFEKAAPGKFKLRSK